MQGVSQCGIVQHGWLYVYGLFGAFLERPERENIVWFASDGDCVQCPLITVYAANWFQYLAPDHHWSSKDPTPRNFNQAVADIRAREELKDSNAARGSRPRTALQIHGSTPDVTMPIE